MTAAPLPDACSTRAAAAGEPLAGTAVADARWLLLEQPGPWAPKVPRGSDLEPRVAAALAERCEALGIRVGLLRRTAARAPDGPRACFLASTAREGPWLERHALPCPAAVLDLDLESLSAGRPTSAAARWDGPLYAVCTHGERDRCCARLGRALFRALSAARPDATWQTSHLGGHRFAPTLLHLPSGLSLG
ncbi:MAG TPA: sucrase ferredoxin, partial [Solirubrobacteraceae bacterium]|nr:sucrase ferredoxin [Solirubrobacteraceae bacterium]